MASRPTPEPTELLYLPSDSWAPALVAAGIAIVIAGLFSFWPFSVIGGLLALGGLRSWWRTADEEISRMRREQRTDTAVIPAEPVRRARD